MEIPFVGGAYTGRSTNLNCQECQNLFLVIDQQGGKSPLSLMNTPGLTSLGYLGTGEVRGLNVMGDYLYAVNGANIYKVYSSGMLMEVAGILSTSTGPVWMANNGTQVMITDGTYGYILTGTTVTQIADADFVTPSSLTYQDGYFIVSKDSSARFYISSSYDGTVWDALDYATAEGYPDNLQAVISINRELWLIGKESYEVWYNSGDSNFPFDRISGAVNKVGCLAANSVASFEGSLCWLDENRAVRTNTGYQVVPISTTQVEYQFGTYATVTDAKGFMYSQEGHIFYVLTFPTEGKTWCYDFTTKFWHTRASGATDLRHRANCHAPFAGMQIVGDYSNGTLYKYDLDKYSDDGVQLRRIRAAQAVQSDRKNIFHHKLELVFESGVGLVVDDPTIGSGSDPQAMLKWSDDGGHTWSNEHWADIGGAVGEYSKRAIWRRLGRSRERVYQMTIADPVKVVLIAASLDATPGVS